jgi:RecJ-like exonuclease
MFERFKAYHEEEGTFDRPLPSKWEICTACRGEGHRALHGIAITQDEWADWDDEDKETYRTGGYDTPCDNCDGSGKVRTLDEDHASPKMIEAWHEWIADEMETHQIEQMERQMGA